MKLSKRALTNLFFIIGLLIFAYLLYQMNPAKLWEHIKPIGWGFVIILLLNGVAYWISSNAWRLMMGPNPISNWLAFKVRICGEAVNILNPASTFGGDLARAYLLKDHLADGNAAASVILDRTINIIGIALIMIVGVILFFINYHLPPSLSYLIIAIILLTLTIPALAFIYSKDGLVLFHVNLLKKLRIKKKFSENFMNKVFQMDSCIHEFYSNQRGHFAYSILVNFVYRLLGVVEIYAIAYYIHQPISWLAAYLLCSVTILINLIFAFIPGSLGVLEGSYAGVFQMLNLDPSIGTAIQLIRRVRSYCWAALGLVWIKY